MRLLRAADRTGTGLWNRRITDFAALAIVAYALMEFCWTILGISDNVSVVALAVACVSGPVLGLLEARASGGQRRALRGNLITAIVASTPWIVLGWAHQIYPSASVWQSAAVPTAVRYSGCVLAFMVVILRPLVEVAVPDGDAELYVPPVTVPSQLLMVSLLLISFSATTIGLTLYWLAAVGLHRMTASLGDFDAALQRIAVGVQRAMRAQNAAVRAK